MSAYYLQRNLNERHRKPAQYEPLPPAPPQFTVLSEKKN